MQRDIDEEVRPCPKCGGQDIGCTVDGFYYCRICGYWTADKNEMGEDYDDEHA